MELPRNTISFLQTTARAFKGAARRLFMARTVQELGEGGQRRAERELGWNRVTLRKGAHELRTGLTCLDNFAARGRKPVEARLPQLLDDVRAVVDGQSQTDPQFQSQRLYTRLSAAEVRRQLISTHGYTDAELPSVATLARKLNALGYHPTRVRKCKPKKKIAETDAIFDQLQTVHAAAAATPTVLRLSMDAKATVKVGDFSRRGMSRVVVEASDHDFQPVATVTPVGILLPATDEVFLYGVTSKVTADCLVDRLEEFWDTEGPRFPEVTTLLVNLDNGPECHSHRTQFLHRAVAFTQRTGLTLQLAYYPPYHSKYNPIERCWGVLEQHWNGSLLDSVEAVRRFAATMTWKGKAPVVTLVHTVYKSGVCRLKSEMKAIESQVRRLPNLGKWFITIPAPARP